MSRPGKLVLVGEFGCGNYGNDASLLSVLSSLRAHAPDLQMIVLARDAAKIRSAAGFREVDFRAVDLAFRPLPGRIGQVVGRLTDPFRYLRHVRGARAVIVPGMGVIEGELGEHPFGVPYLLFVTSVLCRLTRTPMAFVAVGASPLRNATSTWLATRTAAMLSYRSFRDDYSRRSAAQAGVGGANDPVTADVAFALRVGPDSAAPMTATPGVGIGVMNFYGRHPEHAVTSPERAHEEYLSKMAALCRGVAGLGRRIILFAGDESDVPVAHELAGRFANEPEVAVTVSADSDYLSIARAMRDLDLVIAARYHNLIAAVAAGRPVIPLTYAEKSAALARRVGMSGPSADLDSWDPDEVVAQVAGVLDRADVLAGRVRHEGHALQREADRELSRIAAHINGSGRRRDWRRAAVEVGA